MKPARSLTLLVLFVVSSVSALSAFAAPPAEYGDEIRAFEGFVEMQMKIDRIPGLSVGFTKDGFLWARGFGFADLENKCPATEHSSYRLASNTKSMTAVAILQLAEEGKIDLDAEVQDYVPYFPRKRWPVTVRQVMGHIGGIQHYVDYDVEGHIKENKDTRESLAIFADFDLMAEPGTKYHYSSYGYNLLGAVIEGAAGQSYGDYLEEHLWRTLGMNETHMDDPDRIIPNRVEGYRMVDGQLLNSEFVDVSSRFAAGGTHSTVLDLLKYAKGLAGAEVLSEESVDLAYTSLATVDGHFTDYGLGWRVIPFNGRFSVYHTGGQPETRTLLIRFPRENFAIALAYNLEGANLHVYSHRLAQLILGEPWNLRPYSGDKVNAAVIDGLWEAFNHGLGYFDRYQKARSNDTADLAAAFSYFNSHISRKALEKDFRGTVKKIEDGRHPVASEAFVKVGSHIAVKLHEAKGPKCVGTYHKRGPLPFFTDYVELCEQNPDQVGGLFLSEELSGQIRRWNRDWERTCNAYTRGLAITPFSDFPKIEARLKKLYARAECFPDFTHELARATSSVLSAEDDDRAKIPAELSLALFPESPTSHIMMATVCVCLGDTAKARKLIRKARKIDEDESAANAAILNEQALSLRESGRLDESMELLIIATELFPEEAALYDSLAEIHLKKGVHLLKKALEIDPGYEQARKTLKKLGR